MEGGSILALASRVGVLENLNRRALSRGATALNNQSTFVYRPGYTGPSSPFIFTDFNALYSQFELVTGPRDISVDDQDQSPAVIPPRTGGGAYDFTGASFGASLERNAAGNPVICDVADGTTFFNLTNIIGTIDLRSRSSAPVQDLGPGSLVVIQYGAQVENIPPAAPFFHVPAGVLDAEMLILVSGQLGTFGASPTTVQIDAGAMLAILADVTATLDNGALAGPGSAFVNFTSQSAFANTPIPSLQPGLGSYTTLIFAFANLTNYAPAVPGNWVGAPPTTVQEALDRIAALVGPVP